MTDTTAPAAAALTLDEKRQRLAALLQKKAAEPKVYPTSFLQQRLWFLDLLEPGSSIYNLSGALRLSGGLDWNALNRALGEVVRRHESLRTSVRVQNGEPVQVVDPAVSFKVEEEDLTGFPEEGDVRKDALERRLHEFVRQPFVLSEAPLFRARLFREGETSWVLAMGMHHIVSDGWSFGLFTGEMNTLYEAFRQGKPSPLPPLALQYGDFAKWQREHFQGGELARQLAFWKEAMQGAPAVLELPTDRPRPATQDYTGATLTTTLGTELTSAIQALARREGATPFMLLLAAFGLLLSRYSGQKDIVVGTPIAGRTRPELEPIFGYFANTLALRTDLSGDPTFTELLRRVRGMMLGAYAHQDFPFEKLVDELKVERSLSYNPLFQVLFALQNASSETLELSGVELEGVSVDTGTTIFDMGWQLFEDDGEYKAAVEFKTGLFDEDTVRRMALGYRTLLREIVADPARRISEYVFVAEDERERMLVEWNRTDREVPTGRCVHELFEERARERPDAVAVAHAGRTLTYAELDARADALARRLRAMGVGADVRVAISVERSPEMVVALLGVLKAGGAYLPVDPAYPQERRAYMLEDSGARVVITQRSLADALPASDAAVLVIDEIDFAADVETPAGAVRIDPSPDSLAYVIYTSGSTGRPKGVMVPHAGVVNLALAQIDAFRISPESRVLQFASFSFDAAVSEVLTALLAGARLHLAPQDALMPGDPLATTLREEAITVVTLPPSAAAVMPDEEFPALRTLVSAGEACPAEVVRRWGSGRRFVNAYGPTETTVCATLSTDEDGARKPSIGGPIANTRAYVLDEWQNPAPIGVPGELCVGGAGVARAYHGRPGLTAEKFIPDPFSGQPGARLYRTGDRARWLADGSLEYLGRMDEQVKIRGFRIELGEIESVLRGHPAVTDAAVIAREDVPGDRRIVAYVVGTDGDAAELRAHLKAQLPEHMVPSAIVAMDALPLTPNGKVDRAGLPAPDARALERTAYAAPRTPAEVAMAEIWAEVLGVEPVGIHDDFFALGGHSLLATRVVSRVRQSLGVELPLRHLFESPTIAELCRHLDDGGTADAAPPIVRADRSAPLPPSFAQERLWFVDRLIPGSSAYNMPVVLPVHGASVELVERVLSEVVRRHEALRTTFAAAGGSAVQVIAPPAPVRVKVVELGAMDDEARRHALPRILSEELGRPFDLERGPLFRGTLLRVDDREQVLALVMHHIVGDAWSVDVLTAEVRTLLAAFSAGEPSPLAPLPLQYADFAAWQRQWLRGEVLDAQLAYWKEKLAGAPALLELPTDRPRPPVQTFNGSMVPVYVRRETVDRLNALARSEGATLFMVLLAAFDVLLASYSGMDDVVVGSPIAGRNRTEVEGLIGFFVNNLVLRTDLSGKPSFQQVVARVKEVTLGAYGHQDVPFERLVEALNVERSLSHSALFQVVFSLQNTAGASAGAEEAGAGAEPVEGEEENGGLTVSSSKFDLTMNLVETPGGLAGNLEFNTDLFDADTMRRFARHFAALAEAAASQPEVPVSRLAFFAPGEREHLLADRNATARPLPDGRCVHELFAERARATPDAVALSWGEREISYAELDGRANCLAHRLRRMGVGPEVPVAISVERSPEMVVGLLGVLKAGGAYLPVDPAYPADRRAYMLADSKAPVLLTQDHLAAAAPGDGLAVLRLDGEWDSIAQESAEAPAAWVTPDNMAYVIYTSGSTGRPKGVMASHRGVVSLALAQIDAFRITAESRVLQFASFSFDAAVSEVLTAVLAGARLHLAPQEALMPGAPLLDTLRGGGVTVATLPPSVLTVLPDEPLPRLATLVSAGEPCPAAVAARWRRVAPVA
jgi:amino acid adenylation domain-containing protein